ncbi:hypothetical protein [uncultured Flavobacterium sp.]|mgnify:FL=1|uniref:hypothetical protein n=1 Tax=uncultured Flavobacterium sp. TaxID=165435 RepID=UPI0030EBCCCF|tara:strand:+ start:159028 stop:159702 length:675 start_codon:yes stop_codon:yes gene_type:complete
MTSKEINSDIEDIEDVFKKIEKSYNIVFLPNELRNLKTFGEISNLIISKINLEEENDCSSQQAFYKLKKAINKVTNNLETEISPNTTLEKLFPRNRRNKILLIEKDLNLDLKAFSISKVIVFTLLILLIISIAMIFINLKYSLYGILFTIILMKISDKTSTKFSVTTVGELSTKMMLENYIETRRNSKSFNKNEIKKNLEMLFIKDLGLTNEFSELTDESIINY